jgi:hypothetical protein
MYLSEPSLMMTRRKLPFLRANPQNLKRVRVPLTKFRSQNKFLALPIQTLLLLQPLRIGVKGKEIMMKKTGKLKLSQPAAEESTPDDQEIFDPFTCDGNISS